MKTRAYNTITELPHGIIKKSSSTERIRDEIMYYVAMQARDDMPPIFPRLLKYDVTNDPYWMTLERYHYLNAFDGRNDPEFSVTFWNVLGDILTHFQSIKDPTPTTFGKEMYIDKKINEYTKFAQIPRFTNLCLSSSVIVNGTLYQNFKELFPFISRYIEGNLLTYTSTIIHGDLCFSNILWSGSIMRLIDPRGSFGGGPSIYGDPRYDLAKLYHSVEGRYEYLINNAFTVKHLSLQAYTLEYDDTYPSKFIRQFEQEILMLDNPTDIKLIAALIFIGMCARHYDAPARQLAMYLTGIRLLNEVSYEL
jgi:hypothetical protein